MKKSLVFDLGAGSGRAMVALFDGQRLELTEIHRFVGVETRLADGPHWDLGRLLDEIRTGLQLAAARYGGIDSIGVDSWGVDYVLIDDEGGFDLSPFHYRHPRSQRGYDRFPVAPEKMFDRTGSQILPVNTAYQLFSALRDGPEKIAAKRRLVLIADAVNYFLTGEVAIDTTLARTTGLLNVLGEWDEAICREAGVPSSLFPPVEQPGKIRGWLRLELQEQSGLGRTPVVTVAGHDTASAVCALPLQARDAFLICGSWSILGCERPRPVMSQEARRAGFGNEGGVEGRPIFLRSLNGLHLLQKLRAAWSQQMGHEIGFAAMSAAAAARGGSSVAVDPSDKAFFNPPDIVAAIEAACREVAGSGDIGLLALAIYRGLAKNVAESLAAMESLTGEAVAGLRVCGGGGQDALLCQLVADSTGRVVSVGPIEASAWGNALMQLVGIGEVKDLAAARKLVEKSTDILDYYPQK